MLPIAAFVIATIPIVVLQTGLILGAPWGKLAMGGKFGDVFPPRLRFSAAIQLLIALLCLVVVLIRGHVVLPEYFGLSTTAIWVVVALFFVSAILNTITSSKYERMLGAPTTIILFASSLTIALR